MVFELPDYENSFGKQNGYYLHILRPNGDESKERTVIPANGMKLNVNYVNYKIKDVTVNYDGNEAIFSSLEEAIEFCKDNEEAT